MNKITHSIKSAPPPSLIDHIIFPYMRKSFNEVMSVRHLACSDHLFICYVFFPKANVFGDCCSE